VFCPERAGIPRRKENNVKSNIIDIDGAIEARTDRAILFHTGDKTEAAWLPLSQVEVAETGIGGIFTVTLPEWLAQEKGLI
jgi:hypothetical protein